MNINVKKKLEKIQQELDQDFGKIKRLMMQGLISKPAWVRAMVWFMLGAAAVIVITH